MTHDVRQKTYDATTQRERIPKDVREEDEAAGCGRECAFPILVIFRSIPQDDFRGYDCSDGSVRYVWRDEESRFEHVLVDTKTDKGVFMTIVLDLINKQVIGHRLMDFKSEYGLRESQNQEAYQGGDGNAEEAV